VFLGGTSITIWVCANKAWSISILARIKIWGAAPPKGRNVVSLETRKIHLDGSMLADKTFLFVDQSSPDFLRGTREESLSIQFLSDFGYLESFRRYSRSKSKVVKNRAEFNWTFFSQSQILGGRPSKSYRPTNVMTPASRHVVRKMFCGDTPTRSWTHRRVLQNYHWMINEL